MGALLSTDNDEKIRRRQFELEEERRRQMWQEQWQEQRQEQWQEQNRRNLEAAVAAQRRRVEEQRRREQQKRLEIRQRQQLIRPMQEHSLQKQLQIINPIKIITDTPSAGYELINLMPGSYEYQQIHSKFRETGKRTMNVKSIQRINNPLLKAMYELKKNEIKEIHNIGSTQDIEQQLYHGTLKQYLPSICKNNFDRRKCVNHKFGYGVSFSPISYYATHYCDKGNVEKIILVCRVIVNKCTLGNEFTRVPPEGFDSTQNPKGHVIVKYDDDTYYPEYVITYKFGRAAEYFEHDDFEYELSNDDIAHINALLRRLQL